MGESAARRSRRGGVGLGMGVALLAGLAAPGLAPPARAAPTTQAGEPAPIFANSRSFRIPFNIQDPAMLQQIAEVHLYVSADRGLSWQYAGATAPIEKAFPFPAPRDGEYWFAVRTRDRQDRLYPPELEQVRAMLRVVVDTTPPAVVVRAQPRRGGTVGVLWEVQDENLDLSTFALEYLIQGAPANAWRRVPTQPRLVGEARWEVGTGLPVTVRVSVADRAGNRGFEQRALPDGLAEAPGPSAAPRAGSAPPPIMQAGSASGRPPGPSPDDDPFAGIDGRPPAAPPGFPGGREPPRRAAEPAEPRPDPSQRPRAAPPAPSPSPGPATGPGGVQIVGTPRFPVSYDVEDGSAESLAVVEMWATPDGGRTWGSLGTDPDRRSPFHVDLGGEGRFGLLLVVQAQNGLGDPRPTPGTPPQFEVIVDTTPPRIALDAAEVGAGPEAGHLVVSWRIEEEHPAELPVVLSIRPESPGAIWQQITDPLPDTGRFSWPLPPNVPARFRVRLDAVDALGNQDAVETVEPIVLDVPRPRGRILGIDPNARIPSAFPRR